MKICCVSVGFHGDRPPDKGLVSEPSEPEERSATASAARDLLRFLDPNAERQLIVDDLGDKVLVEVETCLAGYVRFHGQHLMPASAINQVSDLEFLFSPPTETSPEPTAVILARRPVITSLLERLGVKDRLETQGWVVVVGLDDGPVSARVL